MPRVPVSGRRANPAGYALILKSAFRVRNLNHYHNRIYAIMIKSKITIEGRLEGPPVIRDNGFDRVTILVAQPVSRISQRK